MPEDSDMWMDGLTDRLAEGIESGKLSWGTARIAVFAATFAQKGDSEARTRVLVAQMAESWNQARRELLRLKLWPWPAEEGETDTK